MPGRILVVDDVASSRIILKARLANAFYEVIQASSGTEAVRIALTNPPDLILLDLSMPDLDGLEVCRRLKSDHRTRDIPIVIATAYDDMQTRLAALKAGAEDLLTKPLNDSLLLARVRSLLRARGVLAELALREGTRQALGFSEPATEFTPNSRICLIAGRMEDSIAWQQALGGHLRHTLEVRRPEIALKALDNAPAPDAYVLDTDFGDLGDGPSLLAELRSRRGSRHAAVIVAVPAGANHVAAMALDLGASDVVTRPLIPEELALRLNAQLSIKFRADRLRNNVRNGLQMAVTDPLTGLFNRRYAMSHLTRLHQAAARAERTFAVLIADLDRFKLVNDTHGHSAGDMVLQSVSQTLSANLRDVDLVARIGGEEFMIILPDIDRDAAERAAERLRFAVETTPIPLSRSTLDRPPATVLQTISIGLAIGGGRHSIDGESVSDLCDRADRALYTSKHNGRNRLTTALQNTAAHKQLTYS